MLPIGSKRLQYVVRELYVRDLSRFRVHRGLLEQGEDVEILSKTPQGFAYVDGPYREHPVGLGSRLEVSASDEPVTLLNLSSRGRENV